MKDKTCCFTGHRNIVTDNYDNIKQQLICIINKLIADGIIYYGCGGALGFDTLAAETILELKDIHPQIKLIMVYPCREQDRFWSVKDKEKYAYIRRQADKIVYISNKYTKDCMLKRNRHLVDNSNYCVCYLHSETGGTAYTVKYAKSKSLKLFYIR